MVQYDEKILIIKQNRLAAARAVHRVEMLTNTEDNELMDQYPEIKGFYIVMVNAPIHTTDEIEEMISKRGYRSIYLPPLLT